MNYPATPLALLLLSVLLLGCAEPAVEAPSNAEAAAARARLEASEGGQLVLRAIEAHGGLDRWYATPTSAYTWEYANVGANLQFKTALVADNRTRQIYHDLLTLGAYGDPQPTPGARFAWDGTDAWISPDTLTSPNPRFWSSTGYYFQSIPFILADPGVHYERLPADTLNGRTYDMVRVGFAPGVGDAPDDVYTLYIHPETGRVDGVRYTVTFGRGRPDAGQPLRETLFYYDDYVTADGFQMPTHFRGYNVVDGVVTGFKNEAWAGAFDFNAVFDTTRLQAPANARIAAAPGG